MKQTILITGTSTGLGLAAAVSCARAGHDVFAAMRNPANAPALQTLAAAEHLPITVITMDVDDDRSVRNAVREVLDARGHIDVLVNNAGIGTLGSVEEVSLETFRQVMETNFFGALRCTQAVLPSMRERHSGRIVNISSVAGRVSTAGQSAYCASKWALEAMSEALAGEVRPFNIRVHVIEPGVIETPIFGKVGEVANSIYAGPRRMNAIFGAALERPVPAAVIGDQVLQLIESDSWELRHPGGPSAAGFLAWRASMTDEQYVALAALDDDAWCASMEASVGLPVRRHLAQAESV